MHRVKLEHFARAFGFEQNGGYIVSADEKLKSELQQGIGEYWLNGLLTIPKSLVLIKKQSHFRLFRFNRIWFSTVSIHQYCSCSFLSPTLSQFPSPCFSVLFGSSL